MSACENQGVGGCINAIIRMYLMSNQLSSVLTFDGSIEIQAFAVNIVNLGQMRVQKYLCCEVVFGHQGAVMEHLGSAP